MNKATEVPGKSGQNTKGGDTSTETTISPKQRVAEWAKHPTIAKLREPGKVQVSFPKRAGEVPFKLGKVLGKLNLVLRGDDTVSMKHGASAINEVVKKGHLLSLANSGDPSIRQVSLWLKNKKDYAVINRSALKKFLADAGVVPGK